MRSAVAVCIGCCLAGMGVAAAPKGELKPSVPSVEQAYPQGWTLGETISVRLTGNFLDESSEVRFDSDGLSGAVLESSFTSATIRVSSRPSASTGLHSLWLITRRGWSNEFHFRLTGWKSVREQEPNDRPDQAQLVSPNTLINGVIADTQDSDVYRFHAERGERLAFNVLLGRNGYASGGEIGNLTLTLLDSSRQVLAASFSRFLWDPYLQYQFASAGDYFVVVDHSRLAVSCFVTDCENRKLGESYQLAVGRSPMLWSLWPPAAKPGTTVEATLTADFVDPSMPVQFSGRGVRGRILSPDPKRPGGLRLSLEIAPDSDPGVHFLSVPDFSGNLFPLTLFVSPANLQIEAEPNDTLESSPAIALPATLLGRMDHPGDVDSFKFQASEGEPLVFRLTARQFGSEMLDPNLALLAQNGNLIAFNDDDPDFRNARNRDPRMEAKIPFAPDCDKRSDIFYIQVRDNSKHTGDSRFYLLFVARQTPGFEMGLGSDRIFVERGGTVKVPVSVKRMGGFTDEITVSAEGLARGVTARPLAVKATSTTGTLELSGSPDAVEGCVPIRILGSAQVSDKPLATSAVAPNALLGDGPAYVGQPTQTIRLCVVPPVQFSLERMRADARDDRVTMSASGNRMARVLVAVRRRAGFEAPLAFALEGLPDGVTLQSHEWSDEGRIAQLVLRSADKARLSLGEHRITVTGTAAVGSRIIHEASEAFFLRIEP